MNKNTLPAASKLKKMSRDGQSIELCARVEVAKSFWQRAIGLLKYSSLPKQQVMWIHNCKSIHTFFMRFSIDCIFVDKTMVIQGLKENIRPFRMTLAKKSYDSVIEANSGFIKEHKLKPGDQLYVGP